MEFHKMNCTGSLRLFAPAMCGVGSDSLCRARLPAILGLFLHVLRLGQRIRGQSFNRINPFRDMVPSLFYPESRHELHEVSRISQIRPSQESHDEFV